MPAIGTIERVLRTERLVLRPIEERDAVAMWPWVGDPKFPRFMSWAAHADLEETRGVVRGMRQAAVDGTSVVWAITQGGALIGTIGLHDVVWSVRALRHDRAEIGYWVAPPAWGQGVATEAVRAVVDWAFTRAGLHKVTLVCIADNAASARVAEKTGFTYVGRRLHHVERDGRWHDQLDYECLTTC